MVFDLTLIPLWFVLIFVLLSEEDRKNYWYMPLFGLLGSTVAMATPAGGGIFYFPALTILSVAPKSALAFNFATQVSGTLELFNFEDLYVRYGGLRNFPLDPQVVQEHHPVADWCMCSERLGGLCHSIVGCPNRKRHYHSCNICGAE